MSAAASLSRDTTTHPASLKTLPTDPVPENTSNIVFSVVPMVSYIQLEKICGGTWGAHGAYPCLQTLAAHPCYIPAVGDVWGGWVCQEADKHDKEDKQDDEDDERRQFRKWVDEAWQTRKVQVDRARGDTFSGNVEWTVSLGCLPFSIYLHFSRLLGAGEAPRAPHGRRVEQARHLHG